MWNRSWCEITTTVPLIWSIWPQFYQFPSFRISLLPVSFSSLILPPVNSIQPFILISSTFQSPVPSLPVPSLPSLHNFPFTTFPSLLVISSPSELYLSIRTRYIEVHSANQYFSRGWGDRGLFYWIQGGYIQSIREDRVFGEQTTFFL